MEVQVDLRPLAETDLQAIVAIDQGITGRPRGPYFKRRFQAIWEEPGRCFAMVAEDQGSLVGYAFADLLDGEFGTDRRAGTIGSVGVARRVERRGIGHRLLRSLSERLAAAGAVQLHTEAEWSAHSLAAFFAAEGFRLAPRIVLERRLEDLAREPEADEEHAHQNLVVRSLEEQDVATLARIDRQITGRDRTPYFRAKTKEALSRSGVRVSLIAEVDHTPAGFVMARVDLGEFGRTEPKAVIDTVGVHPAFKGGHVGRALLEQLFLNLRTLQVEGVVTQVGWDHFELLQFLARTGFRPSQRLSFDKDLTRR